MPKLSNTIGSRHTFDGVRVSLWENGNDLSIIDGAGRAISRIKLKPSSWLAIWGDIETLTWDELPEVVRHVKKAETARKDVHTAINKTVAKNLHPRCPHCSREFSPDDLKRGGIPYHYNARGYACRGEGERP